MDYGVFSMFILPQALAPSLQLLLSRCSFTRLIPTVVQLILDQHLDALRA